MQHEEMINERIDQLIAEYLSGSLTADAFQELKNWSQQSDENRMYVRNQIEVWFSSGVTAKETNRKERAEGVPFLMEDLLPGGSRDIDCAASAGRLLERTGNTSPDVLGYGGRGSAGSTYQAVFAGWYVSVAECWFQNHLFAGIWYG